MSTTKTINRTGLRAILIAAAVMVMMVLSAVSVHAADGAEITEISADPEVNKQVTITVKGTFQTPGSFPLGSNYIYYRVTFGGDPVAYKSKSYDILTGLSVTQSVMQTFTPEEEGEYLIEVCRDLTYDGNSHVELTEDAFIDLPAERKDSRTIIVQKDISEAETILTFEDQVYTGSELTPKPVVTVDGKGLVENTDYEITSYADNTNAGTAKITITGMGFYKGTKTQEFQIQPADITKAAVTGIVDKQYGSKAGRQDPRVVLNEKLLTSGEDYEVACEDYENAGTATVVITGKNNYAGEIRVKYTVNKVSIYVIGDPALTDQTYTGSPITYNISLYYGGDLVEGKDYTTVYENNIEPGTATVTITGIGNFKDSKTRTFTINEASPSDPFYIADPKNNTEFDLGDQINVNIYRRLHEGSGHNYIYVRVLKDGEQIGDLVTAEVTSPGNAVVAQFTPSEEEDKGVYEIQSCWNDSNTVTNDNFSPSASNTIYVGVTGPDSIKRIDKATITGVVNKQYTGNSITQSPVVTLDGKTLENGTDYYITYRNTEYPNERCVNVGTIEMIVHGIGGYTGTVSKRFDITPKELTEDMVTLTPDSFTYTGELQKPQFTVMDGEIPLNEPGDYRFINEGGTEPGTYPVTITDGDVGNYIGSVTKSYSITLPLSSETATVGAIDALTYNRKAQTPVPEVKWGETTLKYPDDFTCTYENNTKAGTATVIISGAGIYKGTLTTSFEIGKKDLSDESITVEPIPEQEYKKGTPAAPEVTVKDGDAKLTSEEIDVTCRNNEQPGTAYAVITGKGNYTGTIEDVEFTIGKASIRDAIVTTDPASYVYNGAVKEPAVYVTLDGDILPQDQYSVSYDDNVNAGPAKVTVTAKEGTFYKGSATGSFKIGPADINSEAVTVGEISAPTYNRKEQTPVPGVLFGEKPLKKGTDFELEYNNNTNAGNASVKITGKGNFTGTRNAGFTILQKDLADESITVDRIPVQNYTEGTPATPAVTVRDADAVLTSDEITVSYSDNDKPGMASVTIEGKSNYTGIIKGVTFEIKDRAESAVSALSDKIDEIERILDQYLPGDRVALEKAIEEAKKILADPAATTEQIEEAIEKLNALMEAARELPSAEETEAAILAQKTDKDPAGSTIAPLTLKSKKQSKKSNVLTWQSIPGATAYVIYGNKCGNTVRIKKLAETSKNTYTHKKLTKGTYYKYVVVAVRDTAAGARTVAISKMIHVSTKGGKYGNFKRVTVPETVLSKAGKLRKGNTLKLAAKAVKTSAKARSHVALRYQSSNLAVATVNSKGVVKAKGKGTCYIYVCAQNGVYKRITVKVADSSRITAKAGEDLRIDDIQPSWSPVEQRLIIERGISMLVLHVSEMGRKAYQ